MSRQINYKLNSTRGSLDSNPKAYPQSPADTAELVAGTIPQSSALRPQSSNLSPDNFKKICTELLRKGHKVKFHAPGNSMYPTICEGDAITVMPIETASISIGDIILYRHKSGVTAHRVIRITKRDAHHSQHSALRPQTSDLRPQSYFILRGDAALVFDDPVSADQILGKVTLVEREGRRIDPYTRRAKILFSTRRLASRLRRFVFSQTN